jgi:hypothetical protein
MSVFLLSVPHHERVPTNICFEPQFGLIASWTEVMAIGQVNSPQFAMLYPLTLIVRRKRADVAILASFAE